jgi:hypothetical protein
MKIALVTIHTGRSPQAVPLACAFLQEVLLADPQLCGTVQTELCDFFLDESPEESASRLAKLKPDLVACSLYVWSRDFALALAGELRRRSPGLVLCAGGPEPTANPEGLLAPDAFDFLVTGEGEGPFREAVRALVRSEGVAGLPGLLLPGAAPAPPAQPLELESIGSPYLSGRLDPRSVAGALWQLSRGCDFACSFCFDHKGSGGVRRFALERLEQELRLFARLQVPQVFVLDSTFNKVPERAKAILRLIKRLAPEVHFHFEVRSEFIDPEMAELFASITCSLQIGLQSSDVQVLRGVGRGFDREDFSYRVSLLNQTGAIFGFDLIYGLPGDSPQLFRESLDFAISLYPNHLDIFPLAVLPGTRLFGRAAALGLKHLDAPPYTLTCSPTFSEAELAQAGRLALACDVFYSRGKAVAWFNAVADALKLKPSAFFQAFSDFLGPRGSAGEQDVAEEEIWQLQRRFLEAAFGERKKGKLLTLALDLVDYHYYYAAALMAAPPEALTERAAKQLDLKQHPLALAPSARLARFSYEILDILEAGDIELAPFASCFKATGSCAVIYPAAGEVCTESLSKGYFDLLQALDGRSASQELSRQVKLPWGEAREFLLFALTEGIVTCC